MRRTLFFVFSGILLATLILGAGRAADLKTQQILQDSYVGIAVAATGSSHAGVVLLEVDGLGGVTYDTYHADVTATSTYPVPSPISTGTGYPTSSSAPP
jgi:hypothetical protein